MIPTLSTGVPFILVTCCYVSRLTWKVWMVVVVVRRIKDRSGRRREPLLFHPIRKPKWLETSPAHFACISVAPSSTQPCYLLLHDGLLATFSRRRIISFLSWKAKSRAVALAKRSRTCTHCRPEASLHGTRISAGRLPMKEERYRTKDNRSRIELCNNWLIPFPPPTSTHPFNQTWHTSNSPFTPFTPFTAHATKPSHSVFASCTWRHHNVSYSHAPFTYYTTAVLYLYLGRRRI